MPFESKAVTLGPHARVLVYSDGVFEVERPDGSMWRFSEFVDFVKTLPTDDKPVLDRLHAHVRDMHGPGPFADDFSLVELRL
jgi:sigma-B regulation protein RsbU (phosphoserine phosphatase)